MVEYKTLCFQNIFGHTSRYGKGICSTLRFFYELLQQHIPNTKAYKIQVSPLLVIHNVSKLVTYPSDQNICRHVHRFKFFSGNLELFTDQDYVATFASGLQ